MDSFQLVEETLNDDDDDNQTDKDRNEFKSTSKTKTKRELFIHQSDEKGHSVLLEKHEERDPLISVHEQSPPHKKQRTGEVRKVYPLVVNLNREREKRKLNSYHHLN